MTKAVAAWRASLGADKVDDSAATCDRYARTTQPSATRPACVLFPESTAEVQDIVRVANEHRVVLYPISRGRNWGYGDACAPTEGAAIVDLGRMNRILEVDQKLAYAVIEPGVTQGQLNNYLREQQTGLWMDCTGAGPEASLVGNTLDRGFGHTRYGDHVLTTCGMEIVLADGSILNTGFGHYPNARAKHVYRYGLGPSLDGLFCQSNFGIVTRIGLWLQPEPETFNFFFVTLNRDDELEPLIEQLRPLRLSGILESAIHIGNDLRIFSSRGQYPWEEAGGVTPLPETLRERLRTQMGLGAWNVGGAITGTRAHVAATRKAIRKALGGLGRLKFLSDGELDLAERVFTALSKFGIAKSTASLIKSVRPVLAAAKGEPASEPIRGTYWRLRKLPPEGVDDPIEAGAGVMWISPVLPMTGEDARRVMDIVSPIFARFGFEPLTTFTMINERAMIAVLNVYFDKSIDEEVRQADACHHALVETLVAEGYLPYRAGLSTMPLVRGDADPFWQVASRLKAALDPADIIARGRYLPPRQ